MIPFLNNQDDLWKVSATPFFLWFMLGWQISRHEILCKSRNFPRHPVIPPEVWCFWHIFGGSNTFSTGAPGCLGFVLKVGSFENFKYHDPTKNGSRIWGPRELWCFLRGFQRLWSCIRTRFGGYVFWGTRKIQLKKNWSIKFACPSILPCWQSPPPPKKIREATSSSGGFNHLLLVLSWALFDVFSHICFNYTPED